MCRGPKGLFLVGLSGLAAYKFINLKERRRQRVSLIEEKPVARGCMDPWSGAWANRSDRQTQVGHTQRRLKEEQMIEDERSRMRGLGEPASDSVSIFI